MFYRCIFFLVLVSYCSLFEKDQEKSSEVQLKQKFKKVTSLDDLFYVKTVKVNTKGELLDEIFYGIGDCDSKGNLYLIGISQEIYKIDSNGTLLGKIYKVGNGPGEYLSIGNLCVDLNKRIYLDDFKHERILVYDSTLSYVNYFNKNISSSSAFASMKFVTPNTLICLSTLDHEYGIYKYNTTELINIDKCCTPDNKALQYHSYYNWGKIDTCDGKIYYIKPHEYQIYYEDNCNEKPIIKEINDTFKEIKNKIVLKPNQKYNHSVLSDLYIENDFFIIKKIDLSNGVKNYDIISKNSYILKQNLSLLLNNNLMLIKCYNNKYFAFSYDKTSKGEPELIIYFFQIKKEFF